jgi:hypothetical protein
MTRNSLLTLAAVVTLVAASSTAEARGGSGGSSSGHASIGNAVSFSRQGPSNSVKSSTPISIQHKTTIVRSRDDDSYPKRVYRYRWIEPVSTVVVVPIPAVVEPVESTGAVGTAAAIRAVEPDKSTSVAKAAESTTLAAAANTCLTKEYLDTGAVRFSDVCTKEWAINSTDVDKKATAAATTCLTKHSDQNGIVMFRDTCTHEWAMNTPDQLAQAPQAR